MTRSPLSVPIAIVVGGALVAVSLYSSFARNSPPDASEATAQLRPVGLSDHLFGNPAAQILIVEYSDFDCEFCASYHTTLHQLIASEAQTGNIAWVFRHFPLTEIHPNALSHARAAECAASVGGNSAFWAFADALYARQPVDPATYGVIASSIGLSGNAFAACYASASSTLLSRITADRQNALAIGAKGTPFSLVLVSGKAPIVVDGAYPYDDLKALIDEALAGK